VTASSSEEDYGKATPELMTILEATRRVSRGLRSLGRGSPNPEPYQMVIKSLYQLLESIREQVKAIEEYERDLASIASRGLTGKQRALLTWLAERYEGEMNYTALISRLSEELGIPSSTIRWNLRALRDAGLITAGHRENKGIPVRLTRKGRLIAEHLMSGIEKRF
jgi:DNA-binding transcriptional ArsR family regulator